MTHDQLIDHLRLHVKAFGGAEKWAVSHGLSKSYVNQVLRGARQPGGGILHALKMRLVRVDYYESEEK